MKRAKIAQRIPATESGWMAMIDFPPVFAIPTPIMRTANNVAFFIESRISRIKNG